MCFKSKTGLNSKTDAVALQRFFTAILFGVAEVGISYGVEWVVVGW